ncbi:ABC transporter ATP-binding protein [Candidatus Pelagibacter bacterium]|nr:ABC transporter ATP-binding protein [Candidatus Pelagibacter bacterium]MDA8764297.1 ABC transporter ATP-binding protein [Candidatus Pelagibacter bacterium]MDA8772608.1 ABC transporter ATP-binding protein [Candidatus Pelagibacter bacterium]MDC0859005.1 ABC transporter ATP-binding protein [Pelagibacteraceae bacterium]
MIKNALTVENLTKVYLDSKTKKENKALSNLNFNVKQGEVFGLLGPNGAGKTTFLSILGGTVTKTSGSVNVWGFNLDQNPRQVKASIGIVPQEVNLDAFFSPHKLLELQAGLYGIKKKDRITDLILKMVALEDKANAYSRSLSGGMKRRLLIAKAMVHQPPILILDEPTAGVDVELRNILWKNVKELNKEGVTIILTTHYLLEAQEMCDRIAIIDKGNLVALDTTQKLLERIQTKKINFTVKDVNINKSLLIKGIKLKIISKNLISATYEKGSLDLREMINYLNQNEIKIEDISTEEGDLEDVFVQLTKH